MASLMLRNDSENFMSYEYMMSVASQGGYPTNLSPHTPPSQSPESALNQRIAPRLPSHHHHHHQQQQHQQQQLFGSPPATGGNPDLLRCKRRIQLGSLHQSSRKGGVGQPAAVARRNERERNRVRLVNLGFANLRQHVPNSSKSKKMSKVDTLRSAVEYIKKLQELLGESVPEHSGDENSYPGQSSTGSPTPSMCSEASSPYMLQGDEDDDFIELASWL